MALITFNSTVNRSFIVNGKFINLKPGLNDINDNAYYDFVSIQAVKDLVNSGVITLPSIPPGYVDNSSNNSSVDLSTYKAADLDGTAGYYGFVDVNGKWYIQKVTDTSIRYTVGLSDYTTNWTNRASLTYYYLYEVF